MLTAVIAVQNSECRVEARCDDLHPDLAKLSKAPKCWVVQNPIPCLTYEAPGCDADSIAIAVALTNSQFSKYLWLSTRLSR